MIMRTIAAGIACALMLALPYAHGQGVVAAKSEIGFTVKQMGVKFDGRFRKWTADVVFQPKALATSKASLDIDLGSIDLASDESEAEAKGPLTSKEYLDALEANHRRSRAEGIDAVMDKFQLDAIMAPTGSPAWITDLVNGDHSGGGSSNAAAVAGYPDITVPAGFISGLPVGVSFFGRAWSEPALLKIAYGFEQAVKARKPPKFLPTVQI